MNNEGPPRGPFPQYPSTPASQKIANPPHNRLNGTTAQSSEWKTIFGFGIPAQYTLSPDIISGWTFIAARESMVVISLRILSKIFEHF
jgi:hypothetical protein